MEVGYRCIHCSGLFLEQVSSCDCEGSPSNRFDATPVAIYDVSYADILHLPESLEAVLCRKKQSTKST